MCMLMFVNLLITKYNKLHAVHIVIMTVISIQHFLVVHVHEDIQDVSSGLVHVYTYAWFAYTRIQWYFMIAALDDHLGVIQVQHQ